MQKIDPQFLGPLLCNLRWPVGDPADFNPVPLQQEETESVLNVEGLMFLAVAKQDSAVGQNAIDVAEEEFDFPQLGAQGRRWGVLRVACCVLRWQTVSGLGL